LRRSRGGVPGGRMRDDANEYRPERVHSRGALPDDTVSPTEHRGLPRPRLPGGCSVRLPHRTREPSEARRSPYPHLRDARTAVSATPKPDPIVYLSGIQAGPGRRVVHGQDDSTPTAKLSSSTSAVRTAPIPASDVRSGSSSATTPSAFPSRPKRPPPRTPRRSKPAMTD
jgi:hypothetical protein